MAAYRYCQHKGTIEDRLKNNSICGEPATLIVTFTCRHGSKDYSACDLHGNKSRSITNLRCAIDGSPVECERIRSISNKEESRL